MRPRSGAKAFWTPPIRSPEPAATMMPTVGPRDVSVITG